MSAHDCNIKLSSRDKFIPTVLYVFAETWRPQVSDPRLRRGREQAADRRLLLCRRRELREVRRVSQLISDSLTIGFCQKRPDTVVCGYSDTRGNWNNCNLNLLSLYLSILSIGTSFRSKLQTMIFQNTQIRRAAGEICRHRRSTHRTRPRQTAGIRQSR